MTSQVTNLRAMPVSQYRPSRRGEANRLRKGQSKTHRNYQPAFTGSTPRGMAAKVVARLNSHDWNRNPELAALRRRGYTPWSRLFDNAFKPQPMRISTRQESREALTALSLTLAANCDYNPDSDYMFEVMLPVEELARRMGVLHQYENGRLAYDVLLHALRVQEELDYLVIHRARDTDSGQFKPMRIFLTEKFFTSRGITVDEIRQWLHKFRQWAIAQGLAESLSLRNERHMLKMARMGIDIERHHSLKNRLRQIKRWVVSPELREEKRRVTEDLGAQIDTLDKKIRSAGKADGNDRYWKAWVRWSTSPEAPLHRVRELERSVEHDHPGLKLRDKEKYYRLLLEKAGAH
ncbi:Replication protein [Enterobacteriaceae bacterium H11S18]|uniref:Replication protein n=1 Tax=Dryocola clanedunensis TaxID=2925396 RepID=UPI0022F0C4EE|nr:Replication protein [Dryocola clanedunensis]MCT4709285.1 Replication protein [Dryocola clanedunensis]